MFFAVGLVLQLSLVTTSPSLPYFDRQNVVFFNLSTYVFLTLIKMLNSSAFNHKQLSPLDQFSRFEKPTINDNAVNIICTWRTLFTSWSKLWITTSTVHILAVFLALLVSLLPPASFGETTYLCICIHKSTEGNNAYISIGM